MCAHLYERTAVTLVDRLLSVRPSVCRHHWIFLLPPRPPPCPLQQSCLLQAPSSSSVIIVIREFCIPVGGLALEKHFCMAWQNSPWPSQGLVGPGSAHGVAVPSSFGSRGTLHIAKEGARSSLAPWPLWQLRKENQWFPIFPDHQNLLFSSPAWVLESFCLWCVPAAAPGTINFKES